MAVPETVKQFLADQQVTYTTTKHPVAYTAQEIAAAEHVPGRQLAKSVLIETNKGLVLAVLPAIYRVDIAKLKRMLNVTRIRIAGEADIARLFPGMEVGAMPPFGRLANIPTVVDKTLTTSASIVCNAGSHTETMTLRYRDFEKVAQPRVGAFSIHVAATGKSAKGRRRATATKKKTTATKKPARKTVMKKRRR